MTDTAPRTARELINAGVIPEPPIDATDADMSGWADSRTDLTIHKVEYKNTEEYGGIYEIVAATPDGKLALFSMWENPRRDAFLTGLMQVTTEGPVSGVRVVNSGSPKKPFWLLAPM